MKYHRRDDFEMSCELCGFHRRGTPYELQGEFFPCFHVKYPDGGIWHVDGCCARCREFYCDEDFSISLAEYQRLRTVFGLTL